MKQTQRFSKRLKVLVVNVFFDDLRRNSKNRYKIPQATAPIQIAGVFDRDHCDVAIYNEHANGPLLHLKSLEWPDVILFTGLTVAFDRMLHLTAYARMLNPSVIVIAGGHAVRALPNRSRDFFDYALEGDIETLGALITEVCGDQFVADMPLPRYDLLQSHKWLGYAESTRNCNFKCNFCTLTGEQNPHFDLDIETLETQILAMGPKQHLCFLDNNFYSSGKTSFRRRIDLLKDLRARGQFKNWSAMVTNDFFFDPDNLTFAKEAGCVALFSGVETFDDEFLREAGKKQNVVLPQFEVIRRCLEAGIVFLYGMIFDISARYVDDMRREVEMVLDMPDVSLPSYVNFTIPLLGTPYFSECLTSEKILPAAKLRDMDGFTLTLKPLDEIEKVVQFAKDISSFKGYRRRVYAKAAHLSRRYRHSMSIFQRVVIAYNAPLLTAPGLLNSPLRKQIVAAPRTYITTSEPVDNLYSPSMHLDARFFDYFKPTYVTDEQGFLAKDLLADYQANGDRVRSHEHRHGAAVKNSRQELIAIS